MPTRYRRSDLHPHVVAIMDETEQDDPFEAVRIKARLFVEEYHATFMEEPPFNAVAAASLRGLHLSGDAPKFSPDAEIAFEDGRVILRVNKDRPETRQRFSICHEIGHTLFPESEMEVRCRKRSESIFGNPDDLLETLCDVAASEIMFPLPWFKDRIDSMSLSGSELVTLGEDYQASPESTVRRFVELRDDPLAAVYFSWKLKPTEIRAVAARSQTKSLFEDFEIPPPPKKLRVDYRITNDAFDEQCGDYIPEDKSIENEGPIFDASQSRSATDGTAKLDFGRINREFRVAAVPIFTNEDLLGPDGGCSVAAVIHPL